MEVQFYYSINNLFQSVFSSKVYCVRCAIEANKSGTPCFLCRSLLLSTIALNDTYIRIRYSSV